MVMIEVSDEVADSILCANLKDTYNKVCDAKYANSLYSLDVYENHIRVEMLKRAIKRVYEYYSTDKLE